MAKKEQGEPVQEPAPEPESPVYTDNEAAVMLMLLQNTYALDDAIYNQKQLARPDTFIKPLQDMRDQQSSHLKYLSSKSARVAQEREQQDQP